MAKFEIKVALLGHVSVGKTTVLNALFKDKYSEVSMRRTTAGINYFRIKNDVNRRERGGAQESDTILRDITGLNAHLRTDPRIHESHFDVLLEEPLFRARRDTEIVIVDVPGLNEAGTSTMYLEYVREKWETFDAAIVVMDAHQGVNTEDQIALLYFVKSNMEKREVPLIILCNKVDEPDNRELKILLDEINQEVTRIFQDKPQRVRAFIPISACNAFLYRAASRLHLDEFQRLDKEYIDKIGKEECGRYKWQKMTVKEQYKVVHDVVNDQTQYNERLAACNFDALLLSLEGLLGSAALQEKIIVEQLELQTAKLESGADFVWKLDQIFEKSRLIGIPARSFGSVFWSLWEETKNSVIVAFKKNPVEYTGFHHLFDQLSGYAVGLHEKLFYSCDARAPDITCLTHAKREDFERILTAMKEIVRAKCAILVERCCAWTVSTNAKATWSTLTVRDWNTIIESICILSNHKVFSEYFSSQFVDLQYSVRVAFTVAYTTHGSQLHRSVKALPPQFSVPENFSDPSHWGHLEWNVCAFIERFTAEHEELGHARFRGA